jgi:Domain of Unknown Function (DUF1080)
MVLFLIALACPAQSWASPRWTVLFNGKNLDNFRIAYSSLPVDGRPASALFEVRDGTVHTYPGQAAGSPEPSAYFQTRDEYGDYVLHLEYKWGDKKFAPRMARLKDAGIVFHTYEDVQNSWPRGIECQIEDSDVGDLWLISSQVDVSARTASYQPKPDPLQDGAPYYADNGQMASYGDHGRYVRIRHSADYEKAGWNSVDVVVRGDSAVYLVNGQVNMRISNAKKWNNASNKWERLDRGKILFQAEYAEVFYRNIKIRPVMKADPR